VDGREVDGAAGGELGAESLLKGGVDHFLRHVVIRRAVLALPAPDDDDVVIWRAVLALAALKGESGEDDASRIAEGVVIRRAILALAAFEAVEGSIGNDVELHLCGRQHVGVIVRLGDALLEDHGVGCAHLTEGSLQGDLRLLGFLDGFVQEGEGAARSADAVVIRRAVLAPSPEREMVRRGLLHGHHHHIT